MVPTKISVSAGTTLELVWQNEEKQNIDIRLLRKYCPCATCAQDRSEWSNTYIPLYTSDQIKIANIKPVGSYAISIAWEDGHNTGIYTFDFLRRLNDTK